MLSVFSKVTKILETNAEISRKDVCAHHNIMFLFLVFFYCGHITNENIFYSESMCGMSKSYRITVKVKLTHGTVTFKVS